MVDHIQRSRVTNSVHSHSRATEVRWTVWFLSAPYSVQRGYFSEGSYDTHPLKLLVALLCCRKLPVTGSYPLGPIGFERIQLITKASRTADRQGLCGCCCPKISTHENLGSTKSHGQCITDVMMGQPSYRTNTGAHSPPTPRGNPDDLHF